MRIVVIADTHIGTNYPYSTRDNDGFSSRQKDIVEIFREICISDDWDILVHVGDFFDKYEQDGETLDVAADILEMLELKQKPYYILKGNHDDDGKVASIKHYKRLLSYGKIITDIKTRTPPGDYIEIFFQPFDTLENIRENFKYFEKKAKPVWIKPRIYFGHYAVKDTWFSGAKCDHGIDIKEITNFMENCGNMQYAVFGHHHLKQKFIDDKNHTAFYVGSPMQKDFGDKDTDHGYYIIDTKKDKVEFLKSKAPEFIEIHYKRVKRMVTFMRKIVRVVFDGPIVDNPDAMAKVIKTVKSRRAVHVTSKVIREKTKRITPYTTKSDGVTNTHTMVINHVKHADKDLKDRVGESFLKRVGVNILEEASKL